MRTNLEELKDYQTFKSVAQLNEAIYAHIDHIRNEVPSSVLDVLLCIGRHSLRIVGISFLRQETIAKQIGKSIRTVRRAFRLLKEYNIVEVLPTVKGWRQSVNVCRVLSYHRDLSKKGINPNGDKGFDDEIKVEPILYNQQDLKESKRIGKGEEIINEDKIRDSKLSAIYAHEIPIDFRRIVAPFFDNVEAVREFWKSVKVAVWESPFIDDVVKTSVFGFKSFIQSYKRLLIKGKVVRNPFAYFMKVIREVTDQETRENYFNDDMPSNPDELILNDQIRRNMLPNYVRKIETASNSFTWNQYLRGGMHNEIKR